jgi:hypothetical protein
MTKNEEKLLYWLLRAYIGFNRTGWEEGPTGGEIFTEINRVLANHGVTSHEDVPGLYGAGQRLLRRYDRKEWKKKTAGAKAKTPDGT